MPDPPAAARYRLGGPAESGRRQRRRHAQLGVTAQDRDPVRLGRPPQPAENLGRDHRVPCPHGVEQPDRCGPHGGQIVQIDQNRAPSRPLRVSLDHRRQDRIARRDQIRPRDGRPVVPDKPRPARVEPVEQPAERVLGRRGQSRDPPDRPAHQVVRPPRHGDRPDRLPPESLEHPPEPALHGRVEPERARLFGRRARGLHQRRPDPLSATDSRVDHQPPALPPADVRPVGSGPQPHAAEQRTVRVARFEHQSARVTVPIVQVAPREQPLFVHEHFPAQPVVVGERTRRFDQKPRRPEQRRHEISHRAPPPTAE